MQLNQLSALRHPQFLKYWLGSFTSVGATQLQVMGLGWLVYELSESTLMLGYLGAAAGFPAVLTTLFGGALADQIDKRHLLIVTSLLTAALLGLLTYLDYAGLAAVWHVIAIAGVISIITGFDWPARQAIFPALIEREDMMSAVALTSIIWQSCRMVMPAAGGLIIAAADTWVLFACCSVGFFFMFIVMLSIKVAHFAPSTTRQSTLHQIAEGVRYILNTRVFLVLIGLSYGMFFFASSYMHLMPAFADMLGTDEKGYGYLLSVTGIGSVMGTILCATLQSSRHLGMIMLGAALVFSMMVYGFAMVCWSGLPFDYPLALGFIFSASIFSSMFMIISTTVLQLEVPDALRGRVMGFHAITYNLLPLGALIAGAIASQSNPSVAISITTTIFVAILLAVIMTQQGIRRIDGQDMTSQPAGG